ncbi:MAG: transposase [Magnetococcales bacterium]|nr:transposase [Magnetococcales bacterium]
MNGAINLIQTMPGIDEAGAAMFIVGIGVEMETFESSDRLASWAYVCPGNNEQDAILLDSINRIALLFSMSE